MKGALEAARSSLDASATKASYFLRRRGSSTFSRPAPSERQRERDREREQDVASTLSSSASEQMSEQSRTRIATDVPWWRSPRSPGVGSYVNVRATDFIAGPNITPRPSVARPRPPSLELAKKDTSSPAKLEGGNHTTEPETSLPPKPPAALFMKEDAERIKKLEDALEEAGLRRVVSSHFPLDEESDATVNKVSSLPTDEAEQLHESQLRRYASMEDRVSTELARNDILWPRPERPNLVSLARARSRKNFPRPPENKCFYPSPPPLPTPPVSERTSFAIEEDVPIDKDRVRPRDSLLTAKIHSIFSQSSLALDEEDEWSEKDDNDDALSDHSLSSNDDPQCVPKWKGLVAANESMTSSITSGRSIQQPAEETETHLQVDEKLPLPTPAPAPAPEPDAYTLDIQHPPSDDDVIDEQDADAFETADEHVSDDESSSETEVDLDYSAHRAHTKSQGQKITLPPSEPVDASPPTEAEDKQIAAAPAVEVEDEISASPEKPTNDAKAEQVAEELEDDHADSSLLLVDTELDDSSVFASIAENKVVQTPPLRRSNFVRNTTPLPISESKPKRRSLLGLGASRSVVDSENAPASPLSERRKAARARRFSQYGQRVSKGALARIARPIQPRRPTATATTSPGRRRHAQLSFDEPSFAAISVASSDEEFVPNMS